MGILLGFLLGILASAIAAIAYDRAVSAKLEIVRDPGARALGALPNRTTLEYHHVVVRNRPTPWPLPGRRPAWACQATISVFRWTGEPLTTVPIRARWASQPEPVSSFVIGDQLVQAADMAKMISGRRIDIYAHQDERLSIAVKYQGHAELHLFTNESYQFERACNPAWALESGSYRLRVAVHYERGEVQQDFELRNTGDNLDDVQIQLWQGTPAA